MENIKIACTESSFFTFFTFCLDLKEVQTHVVGCQEVQLMIIIYLHKFNLYHVRVTLSVMSSFGPLAKYQQEGKDDKT